MESCLIWLFNFDLTTAPLWWREDKLQAFDKIPLFCNHQPYDFYEYFEQEKVADVSKFNIQEKKNDKMQ